MVLTQKELIPYQMAIMKHSLMQSTNKIIIILQSIVNQLLI
ncbi:hypothetical protein WP7W18E02_00770 [Aeromonas media]|nr:hypothetical protein WP7W18E02_00770 [Aeromonas media]